MDHGVIFMVCTIVLTVVVVPLTVPSHWRLMAAVWLAVFQIYIFPIQGLYFSLAYLCAIGLWPELLKHGKELLQWNVGQCYLLLLAVQIVSLSWSPDIGKGVRLITLTLPFLPILAATIEVVESRQKMVLPLVYGVMAGALAEAALVIGFRLMPGWEAGFFASSVAHIFINPNTVSLKHWGGFLINPNTAAGYLGITSLLAQALAFRYRRWWMVPVGLFLAAGVLFTGSKGGMILLFLLYTSGCFMLAWPKLKWRGRSSLVLGIILGGVYICLNLDMIPQIIGNSWTVRAKIWNFGLLSFSEHCLRGLGFGGWEISIVEYAHQVGLRKAYAPHNTIIALWSQSGLLAAILGVLFIVSILNFLSRASTPRYWREFMLCATLAMVWYFIHQQIDNWGLISERHIVPIVAMTIGIVYAVSRSRPEECNEA